MFQLTQDVISVIILSIKSVIQEKKHLPSNNPQSGDHKRENYFIMISYVVRIISNI